MFRQSDLRGSPLSERSRGPITNLTDHSTPCSLRTRVLEYLVSLGRSCESVSGMLLCMALYEEGVASLDF